MGKKLKSIWGLAAALLVYNLFVWVIPANSLLFTGQSGPEIIIRKIPEQSFGFVAMDRVLEENRWAYQISAYKESRPVVYFIQFPGQPEEYEWFKKETNRLFKAGIPVYTDCIDFPHVLNRAAMLHQATDTVFNALQRKKTAEQRTPRGKWYLYQLTPKSTP